MAVCWSSWIRIVSFVHRQPFDSESIRTKSLSCMPPTRPMPIGQWTKRCARRPSRLYWHGRKDLLSHALPMNCSATQNLANPDGTAALAVEPGP